MFINMLKGVVKTVVAIPVLVVLAFGAAIEGLVKIVIP